MGTTLLVIYMQIYSGKVGWYETKYETAAQCQKSLRKVKPKIHRTWRYCK